jgi:Mg2+ and Co2+ transporter CorA
MNKVMKVIAVITCLAIIPATVGGLLGVNLTEGNFPIRLAEIFFIIFPLMLLSLYAFYKMEWLR